jgi:hypothetical protein
MEGMVRLTDQTPTTRRSATRERPLSAGADLQSFRRERAGLTDAVEKVGKERSLASIWQFRGYFSAAQLVIANLEASLFN